MNELRRKNNNYVYIDDSKTPCNVTCKAAIFVYLYYIEDLSYYINMLNQIDECIDIYIISSLQKLLDEVDEVKKRNYHYILKENRGRDISALLIETAKYVNKYDYFCFCHDKKAKNKEEYNDIGFWIKNLWENSVGSYSYVSQILNRFVKDDSVGIIAPPEPIGEVSYFGIANNFWGEGNYQNVKNLENRLGLKEYIDNNSQPIFLGNVFWARTCALSKLFDFGWKYEDFPLEPLPVDGTISHAIERIIGYVARDEGYQVVTAMNTMYACQYMQKLFDYNKILSNYFFVNSDIYPTISNIEVHMNIVENQKRRDKVFNDFCNRHHNIYIYGAGKIGIRALGEMLNKDIFPKGFIVSDNEEGRECLYGIPIVEYESLTLDSECGVVVAVGAKYRQDIINKVEGKVSYICY